jgi:hypothetical protein
MMDTVLFTDHDILLIAIALSNASGDSNLKFDKQCGLTPTTNKEQAMCPSGVISNRQHLKKVPEDAW